VIACTWTTMIRNQQVEGSSPFAGSKNQFDKTQVVRSGACVGDALTANPTAPLRRLRL
jgi:hypothetical protein